MNLRLRLNNTLLGKGSYNSLGEEVKTLFDEYKEAGTYPSLPSGIYFYQLKVGDFIQTRKMVLIK
jgi:hypothetical protein